MKVALIANPRSGRHRGERAAADAHEVLSGAGWETETKLTRCAGDAENLAREAAGEGFDAIFACGGDGSVSEVVHGLRGTETIAGVIPAGTGNDFARTLGLNLNPRDAARQLIDGRAAHIDVLDVNDGAYSSVNVMGLGLDARVADRINRRVRLIGGRCAYLIALTQEFAHYRSTRVSLKADGAEWEGEVMLLAIANAISYGAGMRISPLSLIDDGLLDVIAVEHISRLEFIRQFPKVFKGTHMSLPVVRHWSARRVQIATPEPCPVLLDGDVKCHTPLDIRVLEGTVRFWLPK